MKIIHAIAVFLSCFLFACKEPKQTTTAMPSPQPKAEVNSTPVDPAAVSISVAGAVDPVMDADVAEVTKLTNESPVMPFIVSFYSSGEGIDRGFPEKLLAFIESYGNKIKIKIEFSEIHWGREGETDYCFPLSGMQDSGILNFKSGLKDALKGAEHVHFLENQPCRKGR